MFFFKKIIMGIAAFVLILWGGAWTQTNSTLMQGGGFIGLIVGIIILYIFIKMAWRAMGCLPAIIIISGILGFLTYAIGGFKDGIGNVGHNIKTFMGQSSEIYRTTQGKLSKEILNFDVKLNEDASADEYAQSFDESKAPLGNKPIEESVDEDDSAKLVGKARVISADTLQINGYKVYLYGIDAPELNQNCANIQGRSYQCGKEAAGWLRGWIGGYDIECRIRQINGRNISATCKLGPYDLGAAIVNAGWALADKKASSVYVPYEESARKGKRGLWNGSFYMPWAWREQIQREPNIKVKRSGGFF